MTIRTLVQIETSNNHVIELLQVGEEYRIDSRDVAPNIGIEHKHFIETLRTYQTQLEHFGSLPFQTAVKKREVGATHQTYVMLNRNQVLFAITLSRNTEQVIEWKMALIDALDQLEKQLALALYQHASPQLTAPSRKHTIKRQYSRSRKILTAEEIDSRILTSIIRFEKRHKVSPSASDIYKFYFRHYFGLDVIKSHVGTLVTRKQIRELETSHTIRYTLARAEGKN